MSDTYVLAAFNVDTDRAIKYQKYRTLKGLAKGVVDAMEMKADYISLRRIRDKRSSLEASIK